MPVTITVEHPADRPFDFTELGIIREYLDRALEEIRAERNYWTNAEMSE